MWTLFENFRSFEKEVRIIIEIQDQSFLKYLILGLQQIRKTIFPLTYPVFHSIKISDKLNCKRSKITLKKKQSFTVFKWKVFLQFQDSFKIFYLKISASQKLKEAKEWPQSSKIHNLSLHKQAKRGKTSLRDFCQNDIIQKGNSKCNELFLRTQVWSSKSLQKLWINEFWISWKMRWSKFRSFDLEGMWWEKKSDHHELRSLHDPIIWTFRLWTRDFLKYLQVNALQEQEILQISIENNE